MISTTSTRPAPLPWTVKTAAGLCLLARGGEAQTWCGQPSLPVLTMRRDLPTCERCRVRLGEVARRAS